MKNFSWPKQNNTSQTVDDASKLMQASWLKQADTSKLTQASWHKQADTSKLTQAKRKLTKAENFRTKKFKIRKFKTRKFKTKSSLSHPWVSDCQDPQEERFSRGFSRGVLLYLSMLICCRLFFLFTTIQFTMAGLWYFCSNVICGNNSLNGLLYHQNHH